MIGHVMIIDDDVMVRKLTSVMLQKAFAMKTTTCLTNGLEGIQYLEKACMGHSGTFPDLIFLDIHMPHMNGWNFLKLYTARFAELYPNTRVVLITTSLNKEELIKALDYPVVLTCLQKPVRISEVEELKRNKHLSKLFQQKAVPTSISQRESSGYLSISESTIRRLLMNTTTNRQ